MSRSSQFTGGGGRYGGGGGGFGGLAHPHDLLV